MTFLLCLLAVALLVFIAGTARAVRRAHRERDAARRKTQLRAAIYAARVAAEQAQANRRND